MERIYEYAVIQALNPGELADKVSSHINLNPDCQPYGSLAVTIEDGCEVFYQPVVYRKQSGATLPSRTKA